jgi:hypothetical protein
VSDRLIAWVCALVAVALSGTAVIATIARQDWKVSALVRMQEDHPLAELARATDPEFAFVPGGHFDGVYYYAIARDPFARGEPHERIDLSSYRYGHPGYGWLGWIVSGGRARFVPGALLLVGFIGMASAAGLASRLFTNFGLSPWAGLLVAVNPGLIFAVTFDTSESVGVALLLGALLAWIEQRWVVAASLLTGLCLTKEWFLLVPLGLAIWEGIQWLRGSRAPDLRKRLMALLVGPLAFGAWYAYLAMTYGHYPYEEAGRNFDYPLFAGWVDSLKKAVDLGFGGGEAVQLSYTAVPLLVGVGGLLLFGAVVALRFRSVIDPIFVLFCTVVFMGSWVILLYPKDLIRTVTLPLVLLPVVLASRSRLPSHGAS